MSSHRAHATRGPGRFVVLRGGLDRSEATPSNGVSSQDERDWACFAERIGFSEQSALPEDYEDRLAERIFRSGAADSLASEAHWMDNEAISGLRVRKLSRHRVTMGILLAAAAVLIAWTSVGSPSRVASPHAPPRDASAPAVHAVDATSEPEELAPNLAEECPTPSATPAPEIDHTPRTEPNPGTRLAQRKTRGPAPSRAEAHSASAPPGAAARRAEEEPASFVEEVIALASTLDASEPASAPVPSGAQQREPSLFAGRVPTDQLDWVAQSPKAPQPWGLAPTGERWLGVSAQPSDVNSPRAIAVTAQLDVTRAFASF